MLNILRCLIFCLVLVGTNILANSHKHSVANRMGSHGMALLNDGESFYVSHMPLYSFPHDVQLVYKVDFGLKPETSKTLLHLSSRQLISVLPDNFDLEVLVQGSKIQVKADIYDGHFERGGKVWLDDVEIRFEEQIYKRYLDGAVLKKFGNGTNYDSVELPGDGELLIRWITERPAADHIVIASPKSSTQPPKPDCALKDITDDQFVTRTTELIAQKTIIEPAIAECKNIISRYWETKDFALLR